MEFHGELEKGSAPIDVLRYGLRSNEALKQASHPVQYDEKKRLLGEDMLKLDMVRRTYGIQMAMNLATEKMVSDQRNRLPGLPSSKIHGDILCGKDLTIEFSDFLNGMVLFACNISLECIIIV